MSTNEVCDAGDEWALFASPVAPVSRSAIPGSTSVVTDPLLAPDERAVELFWRHVIVTGHCWYWVGAISSPDGYGRFTFQRHKRQRAISAHRFALLLHHPELDHRQPSSIDTLVGEHYCNEPLCVRVDSDHVRVGTQRNNLSFAVSLGRHQGGRPTATINRDERSRMVRSYLLDGGDPALTHRVFGLASSNADQQLGLF